MVGAAWRTTTRTVAGVGDMMQRTGDGRTGWIFGDRTVERSGGAVCDLHLTRGDEERGFLDWASKLRSTVCEWFDLKTTWTVSSGLTSKSAATVFSSFSKRVATVFSSLDSKLVATVSLYLASKPVVSFLVEPKKTRWWRVSRFGP
jgi:hypothetical protein